MEKRRLTRACVFMALVCWACGVSAQTINAPAEAPAYTVQRATIEHTFPAGAKAKYRWTGSQGVSFGEGSEDNKSAYFTAPPSDQPYLLTGTVVWIEGDSPQLKVLGHTIRFTGDVPPTPPTPVKTLRELVTDEQAPLLAKFYTTWASVVERSPDAFRTSTFRKLHDDDLAYNKLTGHGATAEINRRLDLAIGTADVTLEPNLRAKLIAELQKFAAEFGAGPNPPPVDPTTKATAATYVYEKDDGDIPTPVVVALNRLNREKNIVATPFEDDTTDGDGEVPDQYKVPLEAAKEAGLPSLVVTAGATVLKVVKAPTTEADVIEAVQ